MRHPVPPLADLQAAANHFTLRLKLKTDGFALLALGAALALTGLLTQTDRWGHIGFLASALWLATRGALLWTETIWRAPKQSRTVMGLSTLAGLAALWLERRQAGGSWVVGSAIWLGLCPFVAAGFRLIIRPQILNAGPEPEPAAAAWLAELASHLVSPGRVRRFNEVTLAPAITSINGRARAWLVGSVMVIWHQGSNRLDVAERDNLQLHGAGEPKPYALIELDGCDIMANLTPGDASIIQRWRRDDPNDRDLWLPPPAAQIIGQTAGW